MTSSPILEDAPPLAVAPFNAAEAKAQQRAWAEYLNLPIEKEVKLPGGVKMKFLLIPPGEFLMGSTEEEQALIQEMLGDDPSESSLENIKSEGPQHRIKISQPFYFGKFELTNKELTALQEGGADKPVENPDFPQVALSWDDVVQLIKTWNENHSTDGPLFALPTEAQWEYACRAGTTTGIWPSGNSIKNLGEHAWYGDSSKWTIQPVGKLKPNNWGLVRSAWERLGMVFRLLGSRLLFPISCY